MTPNRRDPETASRSGKGTIHELPSGLSMLPWELPRVFLGMDGAKATHGEAGTWLLPVPYEATASWGTDTRRGPQAIIDASRYMELYDQELDRDPSEEGVYTFPALELERGAADRAMAELEHAFGLVLDAAAGRRVIMLGGEHSVSAPAILAHAARCDGRLAASRWTPTWTCGTPSTAAPIRTPAPWAAWSTWLIWSRWASGGSARRSGGSRRSGTT